MSGIIFHALSNPAALMATINPIDSFGKLARATEYNLSRENIIANATLATQLYCEFIAQQSTIAYCYYMIVGVFHRSLEGAYQDCMKQLGEALSAHYQGRLFQLVDDSCENKNPQLEQLYEFAIQSACKRIERCEHPQGLLFTVRLGGSLRANLIGMYHEGTRAMQEIPRLHRAIEASQCVISEVGVDPFARAADLWRYVFRKPFNRSVERALTEHASQLGKSVFALETPQAQFEAAATADRLFRENLQNPAYAKAFTEQNKARFEWLKRHRQYCLYELVEQWQRGDLETMATLFFTQTSEFHFEQLYARRVRTWVSGSGNLLDRLRRTKEPIAVIVGAACLMGPNGLITKLETRGFRVTPVLT